MYILCEPRKKKRKKETLIQSFAAPGRAANVGDGERLIFEVGAMGRQTISGVVDVLDDAVTMEVELPGMLGLIAGALKNRLRSAGQLLLK